MLVYAWRRHLVDAVGRLLSDAARADDGVDHSLVGVPRLVGFADLVSFASVVRRLSDSELAAAVQRFEAVASDIVTAHGGRVVKTVGDEVLYTTRTPVPGVAIGLDLIDAFATDDWSCPKSGSAVPTARSSRASATSSARRSTGPPGSPPSPAPGRSWPTMRSPRPWPASPVSR